MRIHLRQPSFLANHAEAGFFVLAIMVLSFWATSGRTIGFAMVSLPLLTTRGESVASFENAWQEFSIAQRVPEILGEATLPELKFQNQQVPFAKVDGSAFNGRLPETLWVKLDQPGNAFLIAETDAGNFIKILEDATPGFSSPCRLDPRGFGTLQGEPIYFDRDDLVLKTLWIVQDATADAGRIPGWVQVPLAGSDIAGK